MSWMLWARLEISGNISCLVAGNGFVDIMNYGHPIPVQENKVKGRGWWGWWEAGAFQRHLPLLSLPQRKHLADYYMVGAASVPEAEKGGDPLDWEALFFKGLCSCSESSFPQDVNCDILGRKLQGFAESRHLSSECHRIMCEPCSTATSAQNLRRGLFILPC